MLEVLLEASMFVFLLYIVVNDAPTNPAADERLSTSVASSQFTTSIVYTDMWEKQADEQEKQQNQEQPRAFTHLHNTQAVKRSGRKLLYSPPITMGSAFMHALL